MSLAHRGKIVSEETKRRISKNHARAWLGRTHTAETKMKLRNNHLGIKHSKESKRRMSIAKIGKKWSASHRENYFNMLRVRTNPFHFKSVIQKTIDDFIVNKWKTITLAAKELKINSSAITMVANQTPIKINGKNYYRKTAGGFKWEYLFTPNEQGEINL